MVARSSFPQIPTELLFNVPVLPLRSNVPLVVALPTAIEPRATAFADIEEASDAGCHEEEAGHASLL